MQEMASKENLVSVIKSFGNEMFTKPQADGKISSNFLKATGLSSWSMSETADADPTHIN
jgi:hypothetical protein